MKKSIATTILTFLTFSAVAQYGSRDSNRIGIAAGINQFTLNTGNFDTKPGTGFNAGFSLRGNWYNDFDMVFGMQFSENNFSVKTNALIENGYVDYKLQSVQIFILPSYKIVENHLSVELGPTVQINGKLTLNEQDELQTISGTTLLAKDIVGISTVQFYPTVGITGGVKHFRANITFQYGVNNILGKLNGNGLGENFKGHGSIITGNICVYL